MMDITKLDTQGAFRLEDEGDGIARLIFDLPGEKVNKLTARVLEDLEAILKALALEPSLRALIFWGGKESSGTFLAGADIHEIRSVNDADEAFRKSQRGQEVLGLFSSLPAVTVAAIHGMCLGGGTELALACDLRIASHSPRTRIGLPEVQLGILPGFGGTQRLPRLVGIARALPMILEGKRLDVHQAAKIGLVDMAVYPDLLRREAKALASRALLNGGKKYRPPARKGPPLFQKLLERTRRGRSLIRFLARRQIEKASGQFYPAPYRALDAVIDGFGKNLEEGLKLEASLVKDLAVSPITKNLIDIYLSAEEMKRGKKRAPVDEPGGLEGAVAEAPRSPTSVSGLNRGRIGLLGAGVMGGGIAALLVQKGYRVRMKDVSLPALESGLARVHDTLSTLEKKKRMTRRDVANRMAAISVTTDDSGFEGVLAVIEAIVEDMEVKKKVLRDVEEKIPEGALLATNTSALSISVLQSALKRPDRMVGLHFFNPVERMPLVEVVRGRLSSEEALGQAETLARDLGKVPIRVEDGPGFLVNRLLAPYLNEAARLFEEGFSPASIDRAVKNFGMRMGPFELLDEVGFDVAAKVAETLHQALGERAKPPQILRRLLDEGKLLGKKSGKGFYLHEKRDGAKTAPNPEALRFVGRSFKPDTEEAWVKQLIYPIINEAARVLDEKIVDRPSLVDLAMFLGTGFAPFRGGPLRYADSLGVGQVVDFLEQSGEARLKPSDLLSRLAREGSKFYDLEQAWVASTG